MFSNLVGETLVEIKGMYKGSDQIVFITESGRRFVMEHIQDCCEHVRVEDVALVGEITGSPVLEAIELTGANDDAYRPKYAQSYTWTFYTIKTVLGHVVIRWLGESNGYYSEKVDFVELTPGA